MKTWLECVKEAATAEGWITGQDFINAQSENTLDVFSVAAKMYYNSHKQVVSGKNLPSFLYDDGYDNIRVGVYGDTIVTDEWSAWLNACADTKGGKNG